MRHRVNGKKLSLNHNQRKALFKNLINSLILQGQIKTTEAKAKAIKRLAEKLITRGKEQTLHARRVIAAFLQNKKAVNRIVDELAPLFKKRAGGYTRVVRLGERRGDRAPMVKLELVEKAEKEKTEKVAKKSDNKKATPKRTTLKR